MPITPAGLTATLMYSLISVGDIGIGMPKLALSIANGVSIWAPKAIVLIVGTGVLGTGVVSVPVIIPPQLLMVNMLTAFASSGILGIMSPPTAIGIANGLALGFAQGLIVAAFPGVGLGLGVARINGPPPLVDMQAGFVAAGMKGTGSVRMATAIANALQQTFAIWVMPVPIVGPAGPLPGAGTTVGQIV